MIYFKNFTDLDRTFYVSLLIKAADSILEIIGGILVLFTTPVQINNIASTLTQHELSQDPHDFLANHILKATHDFTNGGRYFAAFYLLSHGIVKIVIIAALFKQRLWAYPSMIVVLGLFVAYQLYRINDRFSIGLVLLTLFDIFVIWLTWKEYKRHKIKLANKT
ncbi:DUF2127 domain-containing protein [Candidatus Saccharibacteria bacterium CG10_big_fil_rev_8_21_14_0_10_47_8]|nr:MAG: DUF2127 domain-containing protein [Candidatus Saccharibacteria bacterium CG10_big_fil_rev_8_21_14_0_10_47_8]